MEKKKDGNDSDIKKNLRASIEQAHTSLLEHIDADTKGIERAKEIVRETIDYLKTNPDSVAFDKVINGLGIYLKNESIDLKTSHRIFYGVREWFSSVVMRAERAGTQKEIERAKFMYYGVNSIAHNFFEEIFLQELKKADLTEQSRYVKELQLIYPEQLYPFIWTGLKAALKLIQPEIEPEIEKEVSESSTLTTTQQVLAVRYFLRYIGAKDIDSSVIARLITVLRNGKNHREAYDKVRDLNLHFNKNGDDARKIADLFKQVEQPQIAKMIENDLDEINPRRNKF